MHWFWLSALVIFIVMEASTNALVSIWFVGGSLAALLATIFGAPIWAQVILFFAVSAALLFALRPMMHKFVTPQKIVTNARSNVGKHALVTETVNNLLGKGAVQIGGVFWSARSADGSVIEEGTLVRVTELEGVKVCVEKVEEMEESKL